MSVGNRRHGRLRLCTARLLIVILVLSETAALAQEEDGHFEVRSASAELIGGVYYLNAEIEYRLSEAAKEALESGVALTIELQIEVSRVRRFRPDPEVASLRQRYELQYHALSQRYVVRNVNSGEQVSFPSIDSALAGLGAVSGLPLLDEALLDEDRPYRARLRAGLDTEGFPGPMRLLIFWLDEWQLVSEWYEWQLRP